MSKGRIGSYLHCSFPWPWRTSARPLWPAVLQTWFHFLSCKSCPAACTNSNPAKEISGRDNVGVRDVAPAPAHEYRGCGFIPENVQIMVVPASVGVVPRLREMFHQELISMTLFETRACSTASLSACSRWRRNLFWRYSPAEIEQRLLFWCCSLVCLHQGRASPLR